jgi:hypothetical protein
LWFSHRFLGRGRDHGLPHEPVVLSAVTADALIIELDIRVGVSITDRAQIG